VLLEPTNLLSLIKKMYDSVYNMQLLPLNQYNVYTATGQHLQDMIV
jgi:hypothetical protein